MHGLTWDVWCADDFRHFAITKAWSDIDTDPTWILLVMRTRGDI